MDLYLAVFDLLLRSGIGFVVTFVVSGLLFVLLNYVFYQSYFKSSKIQPAKDDPGTHTQRFTTIETKSHHLVSSLQRLN
jgi:hypothetical protein